MNEDNKKITMDEIKKLDEELDLGDNYMEQIFQVELDAQWSDVEVNRRAKLDEIVRKSVTPTPTSPSESPKESIAEGEDSNENKQD